MTVSTTTVPASDLDAPGAGTIPSLLAKQVRLRPNAVAMRHKQLGIWRETTWAEFQGKVVRVALALREAGIGPGDRVGLIADNEPAWLFVDVGAQALGAMSVAVYPTQVAAEVGYIMSHSRVKVIVCGDQEQVDKILSQRNIGTLPDLEKIVAFDMLGVSEYNDPMIQSFADFLASAGTHGEDAGAFEKLLSGLSPADIAFIGYTSGTTGKPKGALLRHRNQVATASAMADWIGITERDTDFCYLPLCHPAVRVCDAYLSMYAGASINFPESGESTNRDLVDLAPTFMLGTPRTFEVMKADIETRIQRAAPVKRAAYRAATRIMQSDLDARLAGERGKPIRRWLAHQAVGRFVRDKMGLVKIRYATCGGSSVSPELLKFFWALGVPVREVYGTSETSGLAFSQKDTTDIGTAGWVLPGFEARIAEGNELQVKGAGIFAGYLDDPERTASVFDGDWYRTGDIARFDEHGRLVILDREKHVIKTSSGQDLSPSEIENKLKLSPYIADAMVLGDEAGRVTALVQLEYDTLADWAQRKNIAYTTFKSMTENRQIVDLIASEIAQTNKILTESKQVKDFRLLPRELDPDLDEITPTRKIKRNVVSERFQVLIAEMYEDQTTRSA